MSIQLWSQEVPNRPLHPLWKRTGQYHNVKFILESDSVTCTVNWEIFVIEIFLYLIPNTKIMTHGHIININVHGKALFV